jgi:hypothetical protein
VGRRTPWGIADYAKPYGDGIVFYSTPGHGGFHVRADLNKQIPDYMRQASGFYEEDCAWAIVATIFPAAFTESQRESAKSSLRNWEPEVYERFYGVTVKPGESHVRDQQLFQEAHARDWVAIAAMGDWAEGVPKGYVRVTATLGGQRGRSGSSPEEKSFVVPEEEYEARGKYGFVVDVARHREEPPRGLGALAATLTAREGEERTR